MKSLKPNELHNYIYQSGPEDEAWKLPTGIGRPTILDDAKGPFRLRTLGPFGQSYGHLSDEIDYSQPSLSDRIKS